MAGRPLGGALGVDEKTVRNDMRRHEIAEGSAIEHRAPADG
jgi:hypothetical protein